MNKATHFLYIIVLAFIGGLAASKKDWLIPGVVLLTLDSLLIFWLLFRLVDEI